MMEEMRISIVVILCLILGCISVFFPLLVKWKRREEKENTKTMLISLVIFLSATMFGNIFIAIAGDSASVMDAGKGLLKIEGIILLGYLLSRYFLQGKQQPMSTLIVGLTAVIGYLSQFVSGFCAMVGARDWKMADLTMLVVMIGIVDVILTALIQKKLKNTSNYE